MMILCNQTFAYIDRKLEVRKDKQRKEIFSQSCISLSGNSIYTTTTNNTTSSSEGFYAPPGLSRTEEFQKVSTEDSHHKDKINLFTSNSICTTISAISSLNRSINVKGRCLSCSLDGLKLLHPQCCGKLDVNFSTGILTTVSQKNDSILNISLRSSITFSNTWPKRDGKNRSMKQSKKVEYHSLTVHDQCHRDNYDSNLDSSDTPVSTKIANIGRSLPRNQRSNSFNDENWNLSGKYFDPNLGSIINTSDNLGDDLCDDWDDGHSSQDEDDDMEMNIMKDQDVEREAIEVDLYNLSDHGSDQLDTKHNAVMSICDWSFMEENNKRKKRASKNKKGVESCSVSSCSLSGDEESDDAGSIDRYLMKKISVKKNQREHQVQISTICDIYCLFENCFLLNKIG